MIGKGVTAFYPTQTKVKLINGTSQRSNRISITEHFLRLRHLKPNQILRLRQRKPPLPPFLLSSHPCRQQNRQNPNGSPGFPNGKPENHLRRRNRQHNNNISRSSKVQERTAGESH